MSNWMSNQKWKSPIVENKICNSFWKCPIVCPIMFENVQLFWINNEALRVILLETGIVKHFKNGHELNENGNDSFKSYDVFDRLESFISF